MHREKKAEASNIIQGEMMF